MIRAKPTRLHPFGRLASCHSGKPYAQSVVLGNHCRGLGATLSSLTLQAALARMRHGVALSLQQTRPWQPSPESFGSESMPGRSQHLDLRVPREVKRSCLHVIPTLPYGSRPSPAHPRVSRHQPLGTIGRELSVLNGCIDSCWGLAGKSILGSRRGLVCSSLRRDLQLSNLQRDLPSNTLPSCAINVPPLTHCGTLFLQSLRSCSPR